MNKNELMFGLLLITGIIAVMLMTPVIAYDQDSPYTVTLQWIVPSDTSFSVSLAGAESSIDFDDNLTSATADSIEPDSQDASANTSIITITNDGNQELNFTCNLTAQPPSWAYLLMYYRNDSTMASEINETAVNITENLASGEDVKVFLWTNISSATSGTTQKTFEIDSAAT